jgi:hypothetical protein
MILRRVIEHVRTQNWTAIGIDLVIVVVGVFIGIQVSSWNATQGEHARERFLLGELREELAESIEQLAIKQSAFNQVNSAGATQDIRATIRDMAANEPGIRRARLSATGGGHAARSCHLPFQRGRSNANAHRFS